MKRTSIKDIAQAIGVSTATVSLTLSGKAKNGRISKEMAEKIIQKAKEMNYQPNKLARNLQSGRSQLIGLLIADITNPFFNQLAYYIQEEVSKSGYVVVILNTDEDNNQMEKMVDLMVSHQVDGFIIVPPQHGESCVKQMVEDEIPLVLLDRYYPGIPTQNVLIDNFDASYQATRYLIDRQCKNIGVITYNNNLPHMIDRKAGAMEALQEAGLLKQDLIKEVSYKNLITDIEEAITSLQTGENPIDGLFLTSNTIALNGLKLLYKQKIQIPEDVNVVCFDKSDVFDFLPESIPYLQQPIQSMAKMASRLLLEQLQQPGKENASSYRLPAELIF